MSCRGKGVGMEEVSNQPPTMKVFIRSIVETPYGPCMLLPAPSIRDWEAIAEAMQEDTTPPFETFEDFLNKPLDIFATYRGNNIYTSGGLSITRQETKTGGGNGCTCMPTENCREKGAMVWGGKSYDVELEYVFT